jgi:putative MATE family efflux protein
MGGFTQMTTRIKDMTKGKPARLIITFALPLMLGNIFQQLYTMVDTIVVGRFVGVEALAALGASDWLNWLLLGLIIGFTHGFSILISQRFGAEDFEGLRKTVAMSILLSSVIAIVMTAIGLIFARPMLEIMNTPDNIIENSYVYLSILFSGITIVTAYNMVSSILRAMGDSKSPLYAMIIASAINIVLDIIFVAGFHWGVAGAAIATVIAQLFSFLYCLKAMRKLSVLHLRKLHWKLDKEIIGLLAKLGTPMAFQNAIIGGGGLVVQYVINGFGFIFVAGFTATNKLYGVLELAATSFGFAMATFAGQNLGAKKYLRIRTGMNSALKMAIATALIISVAVIVFGRQILMVFISGTPKEVEAVVNVAYKYLFVMASMLFVLYLLHLYRSALQGMGDTVIPMISGIIELVMRISTVLLLPRFMGETGLYFAEVAAWLGAEVLLMTVYYIRLNRLLNPKEDAPDESGLSPAEL